MEKRLLILWKRGPVPAIDPVFVGCDGAGGGGVCVLLRAVVGDSGGGGGDGNAG